LRPCGRKVRRAHREQGERFQVRHLSSGGRRAAKLR
jgi:hypothetical protein